MSGRIPSFSEVSDPDDPAKIKHILQVNESLSMHTDRLSKIERSLIPVYGLDGKGGALQSLDGSISRMGRRIGATEQQSGALAAEVALLQQSAKAQGERLGVLEARLEAFKEKSLERYISLLLKVGGGGAVGATVYHLIAK